MTQYVRFFEVPRADGARCRINTASVTAITEAKARGKAGEDARTSTTVLLNNNTAIPVKDLSIDEVWARYQEGCGHMVHCAGTTLPPIL